MTKYSATKADERRELRAGVVEGLRGDAYTVAEDLGALKSEEAVTDRRDEEKGVSFQSQRSQGAFTALAPRLAGCYRDRMRQACPSINPVARDGGKS